MHSILVVLDGSECALRALSAAMEHARSTPDTVLHLLTVHSPPAEDELPRSGAGPRRIERLAAAHDEWVLRQAEDLLAGTKHRYTKDAREGDPAESIARFAGELHCDAIFMGQHGTGYAESQTVGSVALRVAELTPIAVRLVK
jgi:nucleotide-binding universal stress UspA family protein